MCSATANFAPASLLAVLEAHVPRRATGLLVALSGGPDSSCLLAAAAALRTAMPAWPLRAVHVDHGLQPAAADFRAASSALCRRFEVPLAIIGAPLRSSAGESIEAAARAARYGALEALLERGECLLTAHHCEDQAETLLLQALRGAGLKGLSGMPAARPFGRGWHVRPLLGVHRRELRRFGATLNIVGIADPMNEDPRFDRVYLRRHVYPSMESRWPAAGEALARSAQHMAEAQALLEDAAAVDLAALCDGDALSVPRLRGLGEARRSSVLRAWISRTGAVVPSAARLREASRQMLEAAADRQPAVRWGEYRLRRYRDRLFLTHGAALRLKVAHEWQVGGAGPLELGAGLGRLRWGPQRGGLNAQKLPATVQVRARRGGERLKPAPRASTTSVQHLCQSHGVLPWMRDALPLLYAGEALIAVADLWLDARWMSAAGQPGLGLRWEDAPSLL